MPRKRKLVDTPMEERPACKFFREGKCVKVLYFQLIVLRVYLCYRYMSMYCMYLDYWLYMQNPHRRRLWGTARAHAPNN